MKKIITLAVCFGIALSFNAQNVDFKASNFKDKKEEFKQIMETYKKADELYQTAMEHFFNVEETDDFKTAKKMLLKVHDFNPNNAEVNMKIGSCILQSNKKSDATPYLEKAAQLFETVKKPNPMIDFFLGQAYQLQNEFKKAIKHYKKFKESDICDEKWKKFNTEYIYGAKEAAEKVENHQRVWVDNLTELNSEQDDFSPCISVDGESLIFTSRRPNGHQPDEFGNYDGDIYMAERKNGKWLAPKNVGAPLSTEADEGVGAFAYDGQRMLLYKMDGEDTDIYESTLEGRNWSTPKEKMENLPFSDANETFACYEPLDIKVYYITDGGNQGGKNVFMTGLMRIANRRSAWGKGQSAGHKINTKFHEGSAYIHPDGRTMYFSSQGHRSIGGYDIYKSTWVEGQWTEPVNLGYPINTAHDEVFFAGTASGKYAYIASNRPGGKGGLDLYKVTFWGPEKPTVVDSEDFLLSSIAEPVKDLNIKGAVKVEKQSLTVFKGKVLDHLTNDPLEATIDITDNEKGEVIIETKSNSATGKFLVSLPAGKNYGIAVKKDGYLFHSENFNIPALSDFNLVNKEIPLKNIAVGSKIALRNVFFATGKADVTADSYPELQRLVKLLKDVPSLKIELSGHTDNVGSAESNKKLSQARAETVTSELVKRGVSASRLTSAGYGPDRPVDTNETNEGRQNNRRTEFEIIAN